MVWTGLYTLLFFLVSGYFFIIGFPLRWDVNSGHPSSSVHLLTHTYSYLPVAFFLLVDNHTERETAMFILD